MHGASFDYLRAEEDFRQAIRLDPDNAYAWLQLAWVLTYRQPPNAKDAERAAREAIRLQPSLISAYYQLGRALFLQQRYEDAEKAFRDAMELNVDFSAPHLGLGQVYLAQGKYDEALKELELTGKLYGTPVVVVQRASIYALKGDKEKALMHLRQALAAGYRDFAYLDASPYLASLRSDPRYQALIRRYRK